MTFTLDQELLTLDNVNSCLAYELNGDKATVVVRGSANEIQKLIEDVLNDWSDVLLAGAYEDQEIVDIAREAVESGLESFDEINEDLELFPLHEKRGMSYEEYSDLYLLS